MITNKRNTDLNSFFCSKTTWRIFCFDCKISFRRCRFDSISNRYRCFSSSVRTSSSFIPISKHRRKRHDVHRRNCKQLVWSFVSFTSRSPSAIWHGNWTILQIIQSEILFFEIKSLSPTSRRRAFRRKNARRSNVDIRRNLFANFVQLPLHGAHVAAPKFIPIAFEPQTAHSCVNDNARCFNEHCSAKLSTGILFQLEGRSVVFLSLIELI